MKIRITPDGNIEMIEYKELGGAIASLGTVTNRRRATHIVPTDYALRIAFKLLRKVFGSTGRIATWTRGWKVQWTVDLRPSGGTVVEPFDDRQEAIAYEVSWLEENNVTR